MPINYKEHIQVNFSSNVLYGGLDKGLLKAHLQDKSCRW